MDAKIFLLQSQLAALGFDPGPIDGIEGPKTRAALAKFERKIARGASDAPPPSGSLPIRIVQAAQARLGIREEGGQNRGADIVRIQSATWLEPGGWPWCAAFVCDCILEAFGGFDSLGGIDRPQTAAAYGFEDWARGKEGKKKVPGVRLIKPVGETAQIEAGDIIIFGPFSHVGIAEHSAGRGERVRTIEGNTNGAGSREGDGVYRKVRSRSLIRSAVRLPANVPLPKAAA